MTNLQAAPNQFAESALIRLVVGRYHVSATTTEIGRDIQRRAAKSKIAAPRQYIAALIRYARAVHLENRKLYISVMRGI